MRGFSRTTMAEVVDASGLSTGSVYRYFASKSDLMLAVVAGRDGTIDGGLPQESVRELILRLATYVARGGGEEHDRLIAQVWGDAAALPELAALVRASHTGLENHLVEVLAAEPAHPSEDLSGPPAPRSARTRAEPASDRTGSKPRNHAMSTAPNTIAPRQSAWWVLVRVDLRPPDSPGRLAR